jgi:hypothetical protein
MFRVDERPQEDTVIRGDNRSAARRNRGAKRSVLLACACLAVGLSVPTIAQAGSTNASLKASGVSTRDTYSTTPKTITWLAAGDSYSSGQGLKDTTAPCARGDIEQGSLAYPILAYDDLHAKLRGLQYPKFVACTGATTADLISSPDKEGHPEWTGKRSMGNFDLVTFTFGGDDIHFSGIVTQCLFGVPMVHLPSLGHKCPSDKWVRDQIASSLRSKYRNFLTDVAKRIVSPGGNILVLGYPELVDLLKFWPLEDKLLRTCQLLTAEDALQLRGEAGDLDATIGQDVKMVNGAHPNGVHLTFLDVDTGSDPGPATIPSSDQNLFESSTGGRHNLCGTGPSWMNGIVKRYPTRSFHPSELGNEAEGRLLAEVLPSLDWSKLAVPHNVCSELSPYITTTQIGNALSPSVDSAPLATNVTSSSSGNTCTWTGRVGDAARPQDIVTVTLQAGADAPGGIPPSHDVFEEGDSVFFDKAASTLTAIPSSGAETISAHWFEGELMASYGYTVLGILDVLLSPWVQEQPGFRPVPFGG